MQKEIQPLFRDVLLVCEEMNLLSGTEYGLKLPSNVSKEWGGTFSGLKKEKIERRVKHMLEEQVEADKRQGKDSSEETKRTKNIERLKKQAEGRSLKY